MKRTLQIVGGVAAVLIGAGLVMPAVAKMRQMGTLPALDILLLLMGGALVALGAAAAVLALRRSQG